MDSALPDESATVIEEVLQTLTTRGASYSNLQTHDPLDEVEVAIRAKLPDTYVLTHPEPAI